MGHYDSFLRSPKMEEQQVPDDDSNLTKFADTTKINKDEVDVMDDLEHILGIEEEEEEEEEEEDDDDENYLSKNNNIYNGTAGHQLNWEFTNWNEFPNNNNNNYYYYYYYGEDLEEEEEEEEVKEHKCFYEKNKYYNKIIKKENVRFWDIEDESKVSDLKLNLNYQEVLDAWSNRGSLWADDYSLSASTCSGYYMGEVPVLMEEERIRRKASVMRYKEKRQNRLFSKKIRYQVRKLNADKRPRLKGRFVKRVSQL